MLCRCLTCENHNRRHKLKHVEREGIAVVSHSAQAVGWAEAVKYLSEIKQPIAGRLLLEEARRRFPEIES